MQRVLMTGAAGSVGSFLRRELAGVYPELILADVRPVGDLGPGETWQPLDITDLAAFTAACEGVDGVLHFAGQGMETDWEDIRAKNIDGVYNLFEAARVQGVKRVCFATSNHAVGYYRRDQRVNPDLKVLPDSRYGVSKAFGEAIGALYAMKHGLGVFMMRIGNVAEQPVDKRRLSIWISPRDMAQLCRIGLEHPDIRYEIVFGVSDNDRTFYDNANAYRLGYKPQDCAEDHAAEVLAAEPPADPDDPAEIYQGGTFVSAR
ncbi:MAG: NAD(P)-dependent oxidoreductase [Alphaproteobacteria bacterium]|nr:NAD(P)-dependent oxidoreductase [Alphaproteobacteria bacterium]MCB9929109.1 NAD(P)-dependent oxidoreductase [Alphaproteobacteria bacterium]